MHIHIYTSTCAHTHIHIHTCSAGTARPTVSGPTRCGRVAASGYNSRVMLMTVERSSRVGQP